MLLSRASKGDRTATDELLPLVYDQLRALAAEYLSRERGGHGAHTLQPTALVHEAYLRLVGPTDIGWENRAHFFGAAAQAIRRILTDHARARNAAKRGSGKVGSLGEHDPAAPPAPVEGGGEMDFEALDEALGKLAELDPRSARIVELRFFGGLTEEQVAEVLGVSPSTVTRAWVFARAWLHREMSGTEASA
jgi:RNA polymerase sigma factor (TIGR02999 family)